MEESLVKLYSYLKENDSSVEWGTQEDFIDKFGKNNESRINLHSYLSESQPDVDWGSVEEFDDKFEGRSYIGEAWDNVKAVFEEGKLRGQLAAELPTFGGEVGFESMDFTQFDNDEIKRQSKLFKRYRQNSERLQNEVGSQDDGFILEAFEGLGNAFAEAGKSLIGTAVDWWETPGEAIASFGAGAGAGAIVAGPVAAGLAATGVGAPVGAVLEGVSAAGVGVATAYAASAADVGSALEFYSRLEKYALKNGLDIGKPSDLRKIYNNQSFLETTLNASNTKGAVEGAVEGVVGFVAPGVSKVLTKRLGSKSPFSRAVTRKIIENQLEGVGGGTGAVLSTVASKYGASEEIEGKELWAEFKEEYIVESIVGTTVNTTGSTLDRMVNKNTNRLKDGLVDAAITGDRDGFKRGIETAAEQNIIPSDGVDYLMGRYDEVTDVLKSVPKDIIKNKTDRREVVKRVLEKEFLTKRLQELESEKSNAAHDNIAKVVDKKINKVNNRIKSNDKELSFLTNSAITNSTQDNGASGNVATAVEDKASQGEGGELSPEFNEPKVAEDYSPDFTDKGEPNVEPDPTTPSSESRSTRAKKRDDEITKKGEETPDELFIEGVLDKQKSGEVLNESETDLYNSLSDFDKSTDRSSLNGEVVNYKGDEGLIEVTDDGVFFEGDVIESALNPKITNVELGISEINQEVESTITFPKAGDTIKEFGKDFEIVGPKYDNKGKIKSVTVKNNKGEIKTLKSKKVLNQFPKSVDVENLQSTGSDFEFIKPEVINNINNSDLNPVDQANFDLEVQSEELSNLETELSEEALLINDRLNLGDLVKGNTKFTAPFDEGVTNGKNPIEKRTNSSRLAKAILDNNVPQKLREEIGSEKFKELKTKLKRWRELSTKNTPTNRRKTKTEALKNQREAKITQLRKDILEKKYPGITGIKSFFSKHIVNVEKALKAFDVNVVLHDDPQSYASSVKTITNKKGEIYLQSNGFYDHESKTIHINPFPKSYRATTVYHEAAHAVFRTLFDSKSQDALLIHRVLRETLSEGDVVEQSLLPILDKFINNYNDDPKLKGEEFFAELVGFLALNVDKIKVPRVKKIKQLINNIMKKYLDVDSFFSDTDTLHDVIHLVNDISQSLGSGKDIVKILGFDPSLDKAIVDPAFQKPNVKTERDNFINNFKNKGLETHSKVFNTPESYYNNFKTAFDQRGVTLTDIQQLYRGLDPNKTVKNYIQEAANKVEKLNSVLKDAGFSEKEIEANVVIWSQAADSWSNKTGRSPEEWWSEIIEDFKFAADSSEIPASDSVSYQADQVRRSLLDRLKSMLPFSKARKYQNQLENNTKPGERTTPLQEDLDNESTTGGKEFMRKNKDVIRGARKITDNHKAIIYITSHANVSTPVHELAHVYEMYMGDVDRQSFLNLVGKKEWDTDVSERFAIGFERFLSDGRETTDPKLQEVFDNFKQWLRDIYNGLFKWGGGDVFLNEEMNNIYSKVFSSPITNLDSFIKAANKHEDLVRNDQVKFNKEHMDGMSDILGFNKESPYVRGTLRERAMLAINAGFVSIPSGIELANRILVENKTLSAGRGVSPVESMGLDYVAGQLQNKAILMGKMLQENPTNSVLLYDMQVLQESLSTVFAALSLANSNAGAVLGAASHRIRNEWFTPDAVAKRVRNLNPEASIRDINSVKKLAEEVMEADNRLKEHSEKLEKSQKEKVINNLNKNIRSIFDVPVIKNILDDLKNSPEPIQNIEAELLKKLKDYYSVSFSTTGTPKSPLIKTMVAVLLANPNINTVSDLTTYMQSKVPGLSADEMVEVLRIEYSLEAKASPATKTISKLEEQKKSLQREVNLIEQLKVLLNPSLGNSKQKIRSTKSQRLIKKTIDELKSLASQNTSDHNLALLHKLLTDVETLYDATLEDLTGLSVRNTEDINEALISRLERYMDSRSLTLDGKKQSISDQISDIDAFIGDIDSMKRGSKEGKKDYLKILRRINEINRDSDQLVDSELFKLKAKLRSKRAALNEKAANVSEKWYIKVLKEIGNTPRALKLSFDYSMVLYQMGFYTMKNLISPNFFRQSAIIGNTVVASLSDSYFEKTQHDLTKRYGPRIEMWEQLGLEIPKRDGVGTPEETMRTKTILESWLKFLGKGNPIKFIRNFNDRAYVSYMSAMRLQEAERMSRGIFDPDVKADIASRINTFTGAKRRFTNSRNLDKKINKGIDAAAYPLISPRLYISVFSSLIKLSNVSALYGVTSNTVKGNKDARKFHARQIFDNLHILLGQGVSMMMLSAFINGVDEDNEDNLNLDPYGSGFMKIQVGDNTITMSPYASYIRAAIRLATKAIVELRGGDFNTRGDNTDQEFLSAIWDEFLKFRMNPFISSYDLIANKEDFMDRVVEHDTVGEKVTNVWLAALAPISIENVGKNVVEERYDEILPGFMLDMVGINSFRRDATSTPLFETHSSSVDFKYGIKVPDDFTTPIKKSLFKQRAKHEFSTQINTMLENGEKPSKREMRRIKKDVEKKVAENLR